MKRFLIFLVLVAANLTAQAELIQTNIKGVSGQLGKSTLPGLTLLLVDVGDKNSLISGLLTVPDHFGPIEVCVLSIYDHDGIQIGRIVMGSEILEKGEKNFEFNLSRSLLEKSIIQVTHRTKDGLKVLKVALGSFDIQKPKK